MKDSLSWKLKVDEQQNVTEDYGILQKLIVYEEISAWFTGFLEWNMDLKFEIWALIFHKHYIIHTGKKKSISLWVLLNTQKKSLVFESSLARYLPLTLTDAG